MASKQEKLAMAKQLQEDYEAELAAIEELSAAHDERIEAVLADYAGMEEGPVGLRIKKKKQ